MNPIFEEEREHLEQVVSYIDDTVLAETPNEANFKQYVIEERRRIWDDYSKAPDNVELGQANQTLAEDTEEFFRLRDHLYKLQKTRDNPYFARIDFEDEDGKDKLYIGNLSLVHHQTYEVLVCDWRADIASLYYEGTVGPASYRCKNGKIDGVISLRRQIGVDNGTLKFAVDTTENITDELLLEALSANTDGTLKPIAESIQKEQNAVIRNLSADLLLVHGSAGSGKTSVALHRLAFLLYHFRNTLRSDQIVIFSPSEVFSDYISSVLPQFGEEPCIRSDFYHFLAGFDDRYQYCDRDTQSEALLRADSPSYAEMIAAKGSRAFAEQLKSYYFARLNAPRSAAGNVTSHGVLLATAEETETWFSETYAADAPKVRVDKIVQRLLAFCEGETSKVTKATLEEETDGGYISLTDEEKQDVVNRVETELQATLFGQISARFLPDEADVYLDFLKEFYPDYYEYTAPLFEQNLVPFEDLLVLSYLRVLSGKIEPMRRIRQIVVDEAQDYPAVLMAILPVVFPFAGFTVLGDWDQQLSAGTDGPQEIFDLFAAKKTRTVCALDQSYRSTSEISAFASRYRTFEKDTRVFARSGAPVVVEKNEKTAEQILSLLDDFDRDGLKTDFILCRTQAECDEIYKQLNGKVNRLVRLSAFDRVYPGSVSVLPVYRAKGLEADGVIAVGFPLDPKTPVERRTLYTAATRALHRLAVLTAD